MRERRVAAGSPNGEPAAAPWLKVLRRTLVALVTATAVAVVAAGPAPAAGSAAAAAGGGRAPSVPCPLLDRVPGSSPVVCSHGPDPERLGPIAEQDQMATSNVG